jgi:hypothetical protein
MKYKYFAVVGLILFLAACQSSGEMENNTEIGAIQASEQPGSLTLYKESLFNAGRGQSVCEGLYKVKEVNDVPDMRNFPYYACEGRYTLTLSGKKGTTLTIFGKFNYQKEAGFMVIVKNDNLKVWIINLDDVPSGKWLSVEAGRQTGGYEVFFRKASGFEQNISSVKWGQWWQGDTPE